MFSKSKLKKMKGEFEKMGISMETVSKQAGVSRTTLYSLFDGKTYNHEAMKKIVAFRSQRINEVNELASKVV